MNVAQPRDGDLGREFPGDGPARLAPAHDTEVFLNRALVDLHHHAVGAKRKVRERGLQRRHLFLHRGETGVTLVMRGHMKAPFLELRHEAVLRRRHVGAVNDLGGVGEESEPALPHEGRIELPESARRRVARIRERRIAGGFTLPVRPFERGEWHVRFAPDFHQCRVTVPLEHQRNVEDGAQVLGDVLADGSVPPGGAEDQPALLVGERDRGAIDLDLGGVPRAHHVGDDTRVPFLPRLQLFGREGVGEREHRNAMGVLGQRWGGGSADPERGAVRAPKRGMLGLEPLQLAEELVVFGVGDFGGVELVIRPVGSFELLPELGGAAFRSGGHRLT